MLQYHLFSNEDCGQVYIFFWKLNVLIINSCPNPHSFLKFCIVLTKRGKQILFIPHQLLRLAFRWILTPECGKQWHLYFWCGLGSFIFDKIHCLYFNPGVNTKCGKNKHSCFNISSESITFIFQKSTDGCELWTLKYSKKPSITDPSITDSRLLWTTTKNPICHLL